MGVTVTHGVVATVAVLEAVEAVAMCSLVVLVQPTKATLVVVANTLMDLPVAVVVAVVPGRMLDYGVMVVLVLVVLVVLV